MSGPMEINFDDPAHANVRSSTSHEQRASETIVTNIKSSSKFQTISSFIPSLETAARSLKVVPIIAPVHSDLEIETAIVALGREPGDGLVVMPDGFMITHRVPIISAAARSNVPAVYSVSEFGRDGGLLSYGPDLVDPGVAPPPMSIAFCAARSRAISRCSCRPSLRWS
jgi:hypothetical protein